MAQTKAAGRQTIPITVWYNMLDGSKPPHGNKGDGNDDPGGAPGPWPFDPSGPSWNDPAS
jgi:hypothetical protein